MSYSQKSFGPGRGKPVVKPPVVVRGEAAENPTEVFDAVTGGFTPRAEPTVVAPAEFAAQLTEKFGAETAKAIVESALAATEAGDPEATPETTTKAE